MRAIRLIFPADAGDFAGARACLRTRVFPRLKMLCAARGFDFRVVARDGQTPGVGEARPCFLLLAGDRCGPCPPPDVIGEELALRVLRQANEAERGALRACYAWDENAVPRALRRRGGTDAAARNALRSAASRMALMDEERALLTGSAAHRALLAFLRAYRLPENAVCVLRAPRGEGAPGAESLKRLAGRLPNTLSYADDLSVFSDGVERLLTQAVTREMARAEAENDGGARVSPARTAALRIGFTARGEELAQVMKALRAAPAVVVTGSAGMGKTALMAEAACLLREEAPVPPVLLQPAPACADAGQLLAALPAAGAVLIDGMERVRAPLRLLDGIFAVPRPDGVLLSMDEDCWLLCRAHLPQGSVQVPLSLFTAAQAEQIVNARLAARGRRVTDEQRKAILLQYIGPCDVRRLCALTDRAAALASFDGAETLRKKLPAAGIVRCLRVRAQKAAADGTLLERFAALNALEAYAFLERCGAVTAEAIAACGETALAPRVFLRGYRRALDTLPDPLRAEVLSRSADPVFFVRRLNAAWKQLFPEDDCARGERAILLLEQYESQPPEPPDEDFMWEIPSEDAPEPSGPPPRPHDEEEIVCRTTADYYAKSVIFCMFYACSMLNRPDEPPDDGSARRDYLEALEEALRAAWNDLRFLCRASEYRLRVTAYSDRIKALLARARY